MTKKKSKNLGLQRLLDELTEEQVVGYLKIYDASYGFARHEFMGGIGLLRAHIYFLEKEIEELELDHAEASKAITAIRGALNSLSEIGTDLVHQVEGYFDFFTVDLGSHKAQLLASPMQALQGLISRYPKVSIELSKTSPGTLYIPFPGNVLFGVMTELVNNSIKHGGRDKDIKIKIDWKVTTEGFILIVADNGIATQLRSSSFVPYRLFLSIMNIRSGKSFRGSGLDIISDLLARTEGSLLFSRSRDLGGLLARVHIPINNYVLRGGFREVGGAS